MNRDPDMEDDAPAGSAVRFLLMLEARGALGRSLCQRTAVAFVREVARTPIAPGFEADTATSLDALTELGGMPTPERLRALRRQEKQRADLAATTRQRAAEAIEHLGALMVGCLWTEPLNGPLRKHLRWTPQAQLFGGPLDAAVYPSTEGVAAVRSALEGIERAAAVECITATLTSHATTFFDAPSPHVEEDGDERAERRPLYDLWRWARFAVGERLEGEAEAALEGFRRDVRTLLELAALHLSPTPGALFTRAQLFDKAREVAGPEPRLTDADFGVALAECLYPTAASGAKPTLFFIGGYYRLL